MYGTFVKGLTQKGEKYGFVNETEVRIGAGISLVFALYSFVSIVFFAQFTLPLFLIGILWIDFALKVFISPDYSIIAKLVQYIPHQGVFWVGALQKRFAWSLGFILSTLVFLCLLIISGVLPSIGIGTHAYEIVQAMPIPAGMAIPFSLPILLCVICIVFMTLESVFGYCVGCKMYQKLVQWGIMKKVKGQNCAGGVCEL